MDQVVLWIGILAAIATIAAAVAAIFAWQVARKQYLVTKLSAKQALYEKRLNILEATREYLHVCVNKSMLTETAPTDFWRKIRESQFLFESDVSGYLEEVYQKSVTLKYQYDVRGSSEFDESEFRQLRKWYVDQHGEVDGRFDSYLSFEKEHST